jgi:hypothetical protein
MCREIWRALILHFGLRIRYNVRPLLYRGDAGLRLSGRPISEFVSKHSARAAVRG